MVDAREVFDDLVFDIEYFRLDAPSQYKRYLGQQYEWEVQEFIEKGTYTGYEEHFPLQYEKLIRAHDNAECPDELLLKEVMSRAREYIKIFYYPCRISLMRPTSYGWFELVSCLPNNRTGWALLKGNFHEALRKHTGAFYGLNQETTPQSIFDFLQ